MATTKPRVNVTLEQHRYDLLKRLAGLQGVSMSYLIADLLDTVSEPLERVCVVLEAASKAPQSVKDGLLSAVSKAESVLLPQAQAWLDQSDLFLADVVKVAGSGGGGGSEGGAAALADSDHASDPRPVTRGSTPLPRHLKTKAAKPAKPAHSKARKAAGHAV